MMIDPDRVMYHYTLRSMPFADQVRCAALAGCGQLATGPFGFLQHLASGLTARDMIRMAEDAGVRITHLDPFARWVSNWIPADVGATFPLHPIDFDEDAFFRIADALEIRSFTAVGTYSPGSIAESELIDCFGALCSRAARHGLRVDLEFIPFWGMANLAQAWRVVEAVNAPNGGILFDIWHYSRGEQDDELLRSIPGARITAVQIDDGDAQRPTGMSLIEETMTRRRVPGEGAFRVRELVQLLRSTGGLNNYGPEILTDEFDGLSPEAIAARCRAGMDWALG